MTKLIIFRHGETDWNKNKKLQGHVNIPLNETGHQQATELAHRLPPASLDIIYSSDLMRAKDTAAKVAHHHSLEVVYDARLREKSFGHAEGLTVNQVIEKFGQEKWDNFRSTSPETWDECFAGGETRRTCLNRVLDVLCEIKDENKYQTVGISTHGGVIRSLMAHGGIKSDSTIVIGNCHEFHVTLKSREELVFENYPL